MYQAATDGRFTLFIDYDSDPPNPRTDYESFGKMICFHRRYNLGDKHNYREPGDLLDDLLDEQSEAVAKPLYDKLKRGEIREVHLSYDRSNREWVLRSYGDFSKQWYEEASYKPGLSRKNLPRTLVSDVSEFLGTGEKLQLLGTIPGLIIQPLYLYDHSIQSISTSSFYGRAHHAEWDSGQVGFSYATPEMIREAFGEVSTETIEKARKLLVGEVETYDLYLRGSCYGFMLYEGEVEIESCWGFLGDFEDMKAEVKSSLPENCRDLVDRLQCYSDGSITDYFWHINHKAG